MLDVFDLWGLDTRDDEDKCYCNADTDPNDGVLAKIGAEIACCAVQDLRES
jgi:hypothetical protein